MGDLAKHVGDFENATPIANHEAHAEYLDNLEALLRRLAQTAYQDADLAAAWLNGRRPKKGRVPWAVRLKLTRRLRAHGRYEADAYLHAIKAVRKWRDLHEEFVMKEQQARRKM
ncbi:hypothetical protein [Microtetraspora malaysiensis]|uniref:Uncharacterized protein n=1 Tax=Microtetraspora malaysiensis TaxID=161358 RepID=A0ABW6SML8_9ACTN